MDILVFELLLRRVTPPCAPPVACPCGAADVGTMRWLVLTLPVSRREAGAMVLMSSNFVHPCSPSFFANAMKVREVVSGLVMIM